MKVAQSCLTLQPHELHSPWNSPGQSTGVGSCSHFQGIFPTQRLNPDLPHFRQILKCLSHQGSPNFFHIHILFVLFLQRILTETSSGGLFLGRGSFHLPRAILFTEITKQPFAVVFSAAGGYMYQLRNRILVKHQSPSGSLFLDIPFMGCLEK